jgi:hypothetical protein
METREVSVSEGGGDCNWRELELSHIQPDVTRVQNYSYLHVLEDPDYLY